MTLKYTHNPAPWLVVWCILNIIWIYYELAFVTLRPHSLPGGKLHTPFFKPFGPWAAIDTRYCEQAWSDKNQVPNAYVGLGTLEALLLLLYLRYVAKAGGLRWTLKTSRIYRSAAARAVVWAYTAAVVHCARDYFFSFTQPGPGCGDFNIITFIYTVFLFVSKMVTAFITGTLQQAILNALEEIEGPEMSRDWDSGKLPEQRRTQQPA